MGVSLSPYTKKINLSKITDLSQSEAVVKSVISNTSDSWNRHNNISITSFCLNLFKQLVIIRVRKVCNFVSIVWKYHLVVSLKNAKNGWPTFACTVYCWTHKKTNIRSIILYASLYWQFGLMVACWSRPTKLYQRPTKLVYTGPGWFRDGWPSIGGQTISVCNQPPMSIQPGHPSLDWCNEYWQWFQPLLGEKQ